MPAPMCSIRGSVVVRHRQTAAESREPSRSWYRAGHLVASRLVRAARAGRLRRWAGASARSSFNRGRIRMAELNLIRLLHAKTCCQRALHPTAALSSSSIVSNLLPQHLPGCATHGTTVWPRRRLRQGCQRSSMKPFNLAHWEHPSSGTVGEAAAAAAARARHTRLPDLTGPNRPAFVVGAAARISFMETTQPASVRGPPRRQAWR